MAKSLKLFEPKKKIITRKRESRRGSRHERGYGSDWERKAARYRKEHAICVECEREDRITAADVVDHKIPVACAPELRLDRSNWWSLCHDCHNGFKRRMEDYAERTGQIEKLKLWCDDPSARPQSFKGRPRKERGLKLIV